VTITQNVKQLLRELPGGVQLVAVAKATQPSDILEAIEAGVKIIGENYIQEAEKAFESAGRKVEWHFIGHLQKNKVKKAIELFDMIETVDSAGLASEIDTRCSKIDKIMPVLIEINSGREPQKTGVYPEDAQALMKEISNLKNIKIKGLMTMGPSGGDAEDARPYFIETRKVFNKIRDLNLPGVEMKYLSMGMSNSYHIAIQEGANIVRIGRRIFGERA
jgi:PLP dependent protein